MKGVFALLLAVAAALTTSTATSTPAPALPTPQQLPAAPNNNELSERAAERLRSLRQEADKLAGDAKTVLNSLRVLEIERQMKAEELRNIEQRSQGISAQLATVEEQIAKLEQDDSAQRPELEKRLVELYKLGQGQHWRMMLSVSDLRDLRQAARMVGMLASHDRDLVTDYNDRRVILEQARTQLTADLQAVERLRADEVQARQAVERSVAAQTEAIRKIDTERDLNAQLAGELQAAQQKLQATVSSLGGTAPSALPVRAFQGELGWPLASRRVTQRFSPGGAGRPELNGVVIATGAGTPVKAVHPGTVAFSGPFSGYGNLVIVDHGSGTFTLYGYLEEAAVQKGATVQADTVIGQSGMAPAGTPGIAGNNDGAGLYFELRIDGRPVDPLQWLKKN